MDAASNLAVTSGESNSDELALVKIVYRDDVLGVLPQIAPRNGGLSYGPKQPRLVFTSPSVSSQFPLDWSGLLEVLRSSSSQSTSEPSCSECEQQILTICQSSTSCSQQTLPCLQANVLGNSMGNVDRELLGAVRDQFFGILSCANGLQRSEWKPIQDFLACSEQAQCQTSEATAATTTSSYLRLRRGRIRFLLPSPTDEFSATITVPDAGGNDYNREFEGSLEDLRVLLESLAGGGARVGVQTWRLQSFPTDLHQVQVTYDEFYGEIPSINVTSSPLSSQTGNLWLWQPQPVLFSSSSQLPSADKLSNAFARYSSRPECNTISSEHLNACIEGDSSVSLVCREVILPCLDDLLTSGLSPQTTPTDFSTALRVCTEKNILAGATPLADFLMCNETSKCPLNIQDGALVRGTIWPVVPSARLQSPVSSEVVATSASPTGTNFTSALRSCASDSGYTAGLWRGVGDFFGCLMANACRVGDLSLGQSAENASYVVAHNGSTAFEVANDLLPLSVAISAPPELLGTAVSSTLSQMDGFAQFSWDLNNLLVSANAGYNLAAVTNSQLWRDPLWVRNFTVTYSTYYGLLPALSGSGLTVLLNQSASFSFQSLNGVAQWVTSLT